jgi:flagellar basal-body rod protein FlgC
VFVAFDDMLPITNICASGLAAEQMRMQVLANNIANASSTRTAEGGPYRRQDVIFAAVLDERLKGNSSPGSRLGGVRVVGIEDDPSEFVRVFNPGHPDADPDGMVSMPNVHLPIEMVNLMTASRAYEANLRVLQSFRQMAEQSLTIGRA